MKSDRLAVVIPALDEEASITDVVLRAASFGIVIVVDDGSGDSTALRAHESGAIVVSHPVTRGYDAALESGFGKAAEIGVNRVVTLDADGEHDPAALTGFVDALERVPLVLGIRPAKQRLAEIVMGWYFRHRFGVKDILCGMKGYHLELYRENGGFDHILSTGTELAVNSIRRGHPFVQLPVSGRRRIGRPRFGSAIKGNLRIFYALWKLAMGKTS